MRGTSWSWRRRIGPAAREMWLARLEAAGVPWTLTEKPGSATLRLEAWPRSRAQAAKLARHWGGQVRSVRAREWLSTKPTPPTRIGRRLEIVHAERPPRGEGGVPRLAIPHGIAFGSGEHATTFMLLRALAARGGLAGRSVLDLGTGSGVLALAARLFGAEKIVATDFDPDAVRTACGNEARNFPAPLVRWRRADVTRLAARPKFDLVLANLFSGVLIEAAPRIAAAVAPGGELWLSGILATQEKEVLAAYRGQGMRPVRTTRRGKWVVAMLAR